MGKLLLCVLWLLFAQHPVETIRNKPLSESALFLREVQAHGAYFKHMRVSRAFQGHMRPSSEPVLPHGSRFAIDNETDVGCWPGPCITNSDPDPARLRLLHRETQRGHEAVGHHGEAAARLQTRHASEDHAYRGQKNPEGSQEANPAVQPEGLKRDPVTKANGGSIGPLGAKVRFLEGVGLLIASSLVVFGTLGSLFITGFCRPIITRWWYVDAILGQVVALTGHVWLFLFIMRW